MSTSMCTSCLSRLRLSTPIASKFAVTTTISATSSFHTSAAQQNVVSKKKAGPSQTKFRVASSAKAKKKGRERPRPPPVGERRTQRKRIVLSNTNALEVSGLEPLTAENMSRKDSVGKMLTLNGELLDQLRDSKAFKTTQNWSLFRQPSTLFRQETVEMGKDFADVNASRQDQGFGTRTIQKIVCGRQASGKSIHLLQAQSMGFLNGWVVLHIPECQDFVINHSAYAPVSGGVNTTTDQMYTQPQLAADILSRLAYSNTALLKKMKLVHTHDKSIPTKKNSTVYDLALQGAEETTLASAIFPAVWKELVEPATNGDNHTQQRPPLLVTIDGIEHWMGNSKYRSADFKVIHAHQFTLIRHFLSTLFSPEARLLPNGGMVLAATSGSNTPDCPEFKLLLDQLNAMHNYGMTITDKNFPMPGPWAKVDQRVLDLLKHANHIGLTELQGLSKVESKGLLEYFASSGVLRERITDTFIGSQWSLSGGGVVGDLCKLGARVRA